MASGRTGKPTAAANVAASSAGSSSPPPKQRLQASAARGTALAGCPTVFLVPTVLFSMPST
jgi:hypothetical protein